MASCVSQLEDRIIADLNVFVSLGSIATEKQEAFLRAVEDRLRSEGTVPHTAGRNTFSSDAPLKIVTRLMGECSCAVVIALERTFFPSGIEKCSGPEQATKADVKLPTPWNQIEAAMAYYRDLPLLMVVESGLRSWGVPERGYDWYELWVQPDVAAWNSDEFDCVLASWNDKMVQRAKKSLPSNGVNDLTVAELIGGLKTAQLWSLLAAMAALVAGALRSARSYSVVSK